MIPPLLTASNIDNENVEGSVTSMKTQLEGLLWSDFSFDWHISDNDTISQPFNRLCTENNWWCFHITVCINASHRSVSISTVAQMINNTLEQYSARVEYDCVIKIFTTGAHKSIAHVIFFVHK